MSEIRIEQDGYAWHVKLSAVADHRAKYYAEKDSDTNYQDEYDFVMDDDYEAIDWLQNNMKWSDIPDSDKRLVTTPNIQSPFDFEDQEWECTIIEE